MTVIGYARVSTADQSLEPGQRTEIFDVLKSKHSNVLLAITSINA